MPPQISLNELYSMGKKKQATRTLCFDRVVELCHRRIRTVASYGGLNAFYEIPSMLVGYPLYNLAECTHYVVAALRKNGFLVQLLGNSGAPVDGVIYISWDPKEIKPPRPAIERQPGAATVPVRGLAGPRPVRLF
jgi:hypothetical protein